MEAVLWGEISRMDKKEVKEALKEAIKEWLDAQLKEVGLWSLRTIVVATLSALLYFIVTFGEFPRK